MSEKVEVGEMIGSAHHASATSLTTLCGTGGRGGTAPERVSTSSDLLTSLGRADSPRVEQERWPFKHVAGELGRVLAVDDVAVLVADVAPRQIDRSGCCLLEDVRLGGADSAQVRISRVLGDVACAEEMDTGVLRRVGQLDHHVVIADADVRDLQRSERGRLQLSLLPGDEATEFVSRCDA